MSRASDPDVELLTSPLQRPLIGRVFIIGGPLGLAIAIALSLYSAMFHVRHSVMLQAETTWIPGEPLAVRALVLPEQQGLRVGAVQGVTWLQRENERADLVELAAAGEGTAQGTFTVPGWSPGPAELHVRLRAPQMEPRHEVVPGTVSESRRNRSGKPMVSW